MKLLRNTAILNAGLFVICLLLAIVDPATVMGINRWVKPMKFTASVAIYLGSLALYWPLAVAGEKAKQRAAWVLAGTLLFEIVVILAQAARGVRSHFNDDSPMDLALFQWMGIAIVVNIATAMVVCRWTFRAEPSAYVWGVRLGLILFGVFAMEGAIMGQRIAHAVGVADGGVGLPILNWSTKGGDLRVAHFLGMHALQGLPLAGWVTRSAPAVVATFAFWAALSLFLLWQALAGKPLVAG